MSDAPRLTEDEIAACEAFAAEHGLAALLDHLGLDELGNEVTTFQTLFQQIGQVLGKNP